MNANSSDNLEKQVDKILLKISTLEAYSLYEHPFLASLGFFLFAIISTFILAFIFNGVTDDPISTDLFEDVGFLLVVLILTLGVYYYFSHVNHLKDCLSKLESNNVFVEPSPQISMRIKNRASSQFMQLFPYIVSLIVVILWLLWLNSPNSLPYWYEKNPISCLLATLIMGLAWIPIGGLIRDVQLSINTIRYLFEKYEITVYALHPDHCGGFSPVGRYVLQLSTKVAVTYGGVIFAFAVNSFLNDNIQYDIMLFAMTISYILITPLLFYLIISKVHSKMEEFRDDLLKQTAIRFHNEQSGIIIDTVDILSLEASKKRMDLLNELKDLLKKYPTWPFNLSLGFGITRNTLLPILPTVVGVIIKLIR